MTYVHQNARLIGEMKFENDYRNQLWISYNHNTGEPIVWQRVKSPKTNTWTAFKRSTGRNITKMVEEMKMLFDTGKAQWLTVDHVCLAAFGDAGRHPKD
jgi:hypothetical protein